MTGSSRINAPLIGRPASRAALNTPALVLDLSSFERNLASMAEAARRRGVQLRPHAKTHKCCEIARRQIAAGAIGLSCAKLAEAEIFAQSGIGGLLLTSPVVTRQGIERLTALARVAPDLMLVADDPENVRALDEAAAAAGLCLRVLVDLDVGLHRTGVASVGDGIALARMIARSPALTFAGLQGYAGHAMHIAGREARLAALEASARQLRDLRDGLTRVGLPPAIVTGGGTGSFDLDPGFDVLTELQVGSYVFMDREYAEIWSDCRETPPFEAALFVQTTVISASHPGRCTTDAGCKAFATEAGPPRIVAGAPDGAHYAFFGDEQGLVTFAEEQGRLAPGSVLTCLTPHCDPTVNLYDVLHVVRDDVLQDIWRIEARGCSQ
ncbi:MAG: DSD1 family PLP-dependent enzyme [Pseudomonadota bacterium]